MQNFPLIGVAFFGFTVFGFYLAYLYGRKTKAFKWSEYFLMIIWPVLGVSILAYIFDKRILVFFLASSVMGLIMDYVSGLAYYKTLNERIWVYKRMSIDGHASLLVAPLWGAAAVIFWFLAKSLGL